MSIAVIGPEKYDLQDLVCAEIALRFQPSPNAAMYLELANGEDAQFILVTSGKPRFIEVQVKGSSRPVKLSSVAQCLAHFPERSSSGCLFERLLSDDRIVLLVMSGRCDDAAAHYVVGDDWEIDHEGKRSFTRREARALLAEFGSVDQKLFKPTKLRSARRARCRQIGSSVKVDAVRRAAKRLFLVEFATDSAVRSRCEGLLRTSYRIPDDYVGDVLAEVVRSSSALARSYPLLLSKTYPRNLN